MTSPLPFPAELNQRLEALESQAAESAERHQAHQEGMVQAYLLLVAQLHRQGALDEQLLQAHLRRRADFLGEKGGIHPEAKRLMLLLADELLADHQWLRAGQRSGAGKPNQ